MSSLLQRQPQMFFLLRLFYAILFWAAGETFGNMVIVTIGVAIASYGELNFHLLGVMLQLFSVCTESTRLTLVQILLQRRGLSLNPITTVSQNPP